MKHDDLRNFDLRNFFDFDHHPHVYDIFIWKGDFTFREMRSAAHYSDLADRFESAISWIRQVRNTDPPSRCAERGREDRVARILQISVMTGDGDVLREWYDDLDWLDMIRTLDWTVKILREMPEPPKPCHACGVAPQQV